MNHGRKTKGMLFGQALNVSFCALLPFSFSPGLSAQQSPNKAEDRLEHILVTGEKLERSYLETFSSVGIVTSEDLEKFDVFDTQDAYKRMANVRAFADDTGSNSITIRGLNADGVTQPANSAALISVVIDGVTQSVEGLKRGSRGLWDVEQLEVHRGPQSTIQGRNALAGTVVIKTKNPTFEPEYRFRGLLGELDRYEGSVAVSGPLIEDELAIRFSGEYAEKTSDIEFVDAQNSALGKDEYYNLRGKLLYLPSHIESLEVLLTANHVYDSPSSAPVSGPDFFQRQFARDSASSELREMTADNYSLDVSFEAADGITLRSSSAYYDSDLEIFSAPGQSEFLRDDNRRDADFTQEFRVEMREALYGFTGVAGLFYGSFDRDTRSFIQVLGSVVFQDGTFSNETETWAAYADLRYALTDVTSLIFGGRYQDDTVRNDANVLSDFGDQVVDRKASFDEFLPKLGVSFEMSDKQTLGATVSRGYRQGFAEARFGDENDIVAVDSEFVWTYELAYRHSSGDGRLRLGANLFYNDYEDQQVTVTDPNRRPLTNTLNAGDSESYGLELEADVRIGDSLSVYAALGLLKTELGEFSVDSCTGGDCSGNEYSEAPEVTASLGGNYQHSSGAFLSIASNYTDAFYKTIVNGADLRVDDAFLVDAKFGYADDKYRVSFYVNNVFDNNYLTGLTSEVEATVGDARTVGIEVQASF